MMNSAQTASPKPRKRHIGLIVLGVFVVAIVLVIAFWDWNWFKPIVEAQASSALGRNVTIKNLDVKLGWKPTVILDGVVVDNPDGFPQDQKFATIDRLTVVADVIAYIRTQRIVIPTIGVDHAIVEAVQHTDGKASWDLKTSGSDAGKNADPSAGPQIGDIEINDSHAHVVMPKLKADFNLDVATRPAPAQPANSAATPGGAQLVVDAKGTYAAQPITGQFVGGALLSIRDAQHPYPINLHLADGPTRVAITGTVQNPLNFAGADIKLDLAGPDMALLLPLTGVPIPQTPPYSIAGNLDYADRKVRFTHFAGRLGSSDLNGDIEIDPGHERPVVTADLFSRKVDLTDLGGFIGATPGRKGTPGESAEQKQAKTKAEASSKLLPDTPINLPKVTAADVRLRYKGEKIEGRSIPLDNIVLNLDTNDGAITVHPLSFAVGKGSIVSNIDLTPAGKEIHAKAKIDFKQVDLSRLIEALHVFHGGGVISGSANLDGTGNSMATFLGRGNGGLRIGMTGGNLSALLVDLSGIEVGNAVLSALGVPSTAQVRCFVGDFGLTHGIVDTKALMLDTSEARIEGKGTVDLTAETINYVLKTDARHFSIGTLNAPINISGPLKSPSIGPDKTTLGLRAGAAVGLGILFPPAALLPTIELGVGEDNACQLAAAPIAAAKASAGVPSSPPARPARPTKKTR
jgi:uncharacterized protein involved in outer membrane biogenesis